MLEAQFFTDTGQHRDKNEDAGGIFYNQTNQQLLVLCDGMGGHKAGEVASKFVTDELKSRFEAENLIEEHQAENWLRNNIKDINFSYITMHKKMQNIKVWVQHVFVHLFLKNQL